MNEAPDPYRISWINDDFGIDAEDDNVDVTVTFDSGKRYNATFFTVENLGTLMERYRQSGECSNGLYIWSKNMIVITRITESNIERAVADLIASGEFYAAFDGPHRD